MKPVRFAYHQPTSVGEAIALLGSSGGTARVLAGGQSLIPQLNRRAVRPEAVVDIGRLPGLRHFVVEGEGLRIGALTTHHDLETADRLPPGFAVVPETARLIGHPPVRSRGTLVGSLAHADPRAEWCLLAVLLDAVVTVRGAYGARSLPVQDLFAGDGRTVLVHDELLTDVYLPRPEPTAALSETAFQEGGLPLVAAGAAVRLGPDGLAVSVRAALAGTADRPVRLPALERALCGTRPDEGWQDRVGEAVAELPEPPSDELAESSYRRRASAAMLLRALGRSVSRARAAAPAF
ncbi:FAD binding domain-containing protein [Streptomyces sp. NPDC079167]|uniref:FAD binding domain-containing protein n=1 Tax=Streptomyces sp. NPDC079167 TaxID=3154513 RepID=UPI00343849CD